MMEQFVNAKQLQRIINPAFNVIPMCWVDEQMGTAYKRKRRPPKE